MNLAFGRCRDINGPVMEAAMALYRPNFLSADILIY